jgi:Protein of unknown function (DUF3575)
MKALAIAAVVLGSAAAHAEPDAPTDVIATQPLALVARGVAVSYEWPITAQLSVAALGGFRAAALGDYGSTTGTAGAELRAWLRRSSVMRGPYLGFHASAGYTRLTDDVMGYAGSSTGLTQRVDLGWRFVVHRHLTITPSLGLGCREDIDLRGRLATTTRGMAALGLEIGWMR